MDSGHKKKESHFRMWVNNLWWENRQERFAYNEPDITISEYWNKWKYWIKREYRYQLKREQNDQR